MARIEANQPETEVKFTESQALIERLQDVFRETPKDLDHTREDLEDVRAMLRQQGPLRETDEV
jgi:hypothetical protein